MERWSWREVAWLMDPHIKTTKGTHTHTAPPNPPRPPPRSEHPWYLWETFLIIRFLGITNQTKEKTQHQNLHLVALIVLLERVRGFQYWRGCELVPLLVGSLCWRDTSWTNGCSPKDAQKSSSISCLAGMSFSGILSFKQQGLFQETLKRIWTSDL